MNCNQEPCACNGDHNECNGGKGLDCIGGMRRTHARVLMPVKATVRTKVWAVPNVFRLTDC
eukprot:COSAG02_NODE_43564_length_373_cov_1.284672_1_plen_60_part_10